MSHQRIRSILVCLALMTGSSALALEEPKYVVVAEAAAYEIRRYEPYLVAEVDVAGESPDSRGFRTLAAYIFGENESSEKMQMTAPVESRISGENGGVTYAFVMESKYTMETLPTPNDERIRIREKPARVVAALRYSGRWTEANAARHEKELLDALRADGINPLGSAELARYNSPFTPWFLRRNEIIVPVAWSEGAD